MVGGELCVYVRTEEADHVVLSHHLLPVVLLLELFEIGFVTG